MIILSTNNNTSKIRFIKFIFTALGSFRNWEVNTIKNKVLPGLNKQAAPMELLTIEWIYSTNRTLLWSSELNLSASTYILTTNVHQKPKNISCFLKSCFQPSFFEIIFLKWTPTQQPLYLNLFFTGDYFFLSPPCLDCEPCRVFHFAATTEF